MAQGLLATRKRRIVGWREPRPEHGPSGPRVRWGWSRPQTANRRVAVPVPPGSRLGGGGGIMALAWFRRRLEGIGRPARLRGSSAKGRRFLPARERCSGSGLNGVPFTGASRRPGQRYQALVVELAFGLALPLASGAGAEGFGCRFTRVHRAGTRPRQGAANPLAVGAVSPGSAPPPEERRSLPLGLSRG